MPGEIMESELHKGLKLKIKKIVGNDFQREDEFNRLCVELSALKLSTEADLSPATHQAWPEDVYGFILHRINIAHREREGLCRNFERGPTVPVWYEEKTSKLKRKLEKIEALLRVLIFGSTHRDNWRFVAMKGCAMTVKGNTRKVIETISWME